MSSDRFCVSIMATSLPNTTKKLLVTFDPLRAGAAAGDFVVPVVEADAATFWGLRSKKSSELSVMVYVGRAVTVNDLFARLVDTGSKIPDVQQTLSLLTDYITRLQDHKIGNVMAIEAAADEPCGFRLKRVANTPSGMANTK